jgi:cytidylate kinase
MSEDHGAISQMRAITVSREYGSGGGEIARRLARRLGWRLVDHEAVVEVAEQLGVSEEEAAAHDEHVEGFVSRILTSMQTIEPIGYVNVTVPAAVTVNARDYRGALEKVVMSAVTAGHVVIVGRGAQVIIAQRRDVLHVRVVASLEQRIPYVMRREGVDQETARRRIQAKDRNRVRYLQSEYRRHPEDPHLYDLVLNTNIVDLDSIVDLICLGLERKARQLSTPVEALGPGTGLTRYPTQPGDFQIPESAT